MNEVDEFKKLFGIVNTFDAPKFYAKKTYFCDDVNQYRDNWGSHFEIALPGVQKDRISVSIKEGSKIFISIAKAEEEKREYIIKGISELKNYTIDVDLKLFNIDGLKVKLENGMLYVAIPFKAEEKKQDITIEIE